MSQVSETYAQAFLSLAKEENKVALFKEQVEKLLCAFDADTLHFFRINAVSKQAKKEVIKEALKDADKNLQSLLCLLVDANRSFYIAETLKHFVLLANKELHIQEITIFSANPLSEEEVSQIVTATEKNLGKKVVASVKLDKTLLAGTRIYINDRVYDSSLKAKVAHLREELLRESW